MPAKSYISRYVVLWCMYMWLFCNFIYLCVYVRLLWPAAIPSAVTLVIKSSVPMNSSVPAQTLRSRFLPAYTQQQQPQQWVTTAAAAARRVLSFQDWVRGESKADVSVREHAAAQQTGDEMAAESSAVRVAPLTQSKEFVPPCSHRDMLNRRCSTAGTQAYWINKHRRSKDDVASASEQTDSEQEDVLFFSRALRMICAQKKGISCVLLKKKSTMWKCFRKMGLPQKYK